MSKILDTTSKGVLESLRDPDESQSIDPMTAQALREAAHRHAEEVSNEHDDRVTPSQVRTHPHTQLFMEAANTHLKLIGYTEHGPRHAGLVAKIAGNVLKHLNYPERQVELAIIAGWLHDIGNMINRNMHGQIGALLAKDILQELGMGMREITLIMGAIGNHEEQHGHTTSSVAAALILADKADVHRSRVQSKHEDFDIHDRVNYACTSSFLRVDAENKHIALELEIDITIASVMDYFEIFLSRMIMCRNAAEFLGCQFELNINGQRLS